MKRSRVVWATAAVCLLVQMMGASGAWAEEPGLAVDVSAGVISALATVFALPVKLASCVATVAIGGVAYGLTMGSSELIRDELVAGTNSTCGGRYYITPQEVKQLAKEPERQR